MTTKTSHIKIKDFLRDKKILIRILVVGIVLIGGWWGWNSFYKCSIEHLEFCDRSCNIDNDCYADYNGCGCLKIGEKCWNKYKHGKALLVPFSCKCVNNICEVAKLGQVQQIKEKEKVIITTNKTEYRQKEEIKIIIGNNLNRKLGVIDVFNGIERYENGNWVNIWNSSEYRCSCDSYCYFGGVPEINPHESMIFKWNQKMWTYCHPEASFFGLKDSTFVFAPKGTYRILVKTGNKATAYSNEFTIK